MRIATWNLERGGKTRAASRAQDETLRELAYDLLVVTEPGPALSATRGGVSSPPARSGRAGDEPWVTLVGDGLRPAELEIPFERMAAAAVLETPSEP